VSHQAHRQEHTEKCIECQAKPDHQCGTPGLTMKKAMDEVKNAVPNKGSDY